MGRYSSLFRIARSNAPAFRAGKGLYRSRVGKSSGGSGWAFQDDYEVDVSDAAKNFVIEAIIGEPANAGQESLLDRAIEEMEVKVTYWDEIPGFAEHTEGDLYLQGSTTAYMVLETDHPEAIGEIIAKGYDAFEEFLDNLNAETEHVY